MKNKTVRNLLIISVIIILLGFLLGFGLTNYLLNESLQVNDRIIQLFSVFGLVALRLLFVIVSVGTVALIWLIYGIIILFRKIKSKESKKFLIIIATIISIIIIGIISSHFLLKNRFDYNILYQDGSNRYNIYKIDDRIEVSVEEEVVCITTPCPTHKFTRKIDFSEDNMIIVNDFIDSLFKNNSYNSIQIFTENLNDNQIKILKSIINNDENLLRLKNDEDDKYLITTNEKFMTMQNDGGTHHNVYYEVNLTSSEVTKYEDYYIGFKGYEYRGKVIYNKNIDRELQNEIRKLLNNLFSEEDINDTKNYSPYTIKPSDENLLTIYNEKSINSLKELLNKIDNL